MINFTISSACGSRPTVGVSFTGSAGYVATERDGLGDSGSDAFVLAPGISWAIFDLGHVQARIGASRANRDGALLRYEQTVLQALEETENSLVTHARSRDRLVHDEEALKASTTAADLARVRYENGASDFLQVLDAERTLLESEDRLARSAPRPPRVSSRYTSPSAGVGKPLPGHNNSQPG